MLSDAIRGRVLNEVDMTLGQLANRVPLRGWGRPVQADFLRDGGHRTRQLELAGESSPGHSLLRSTPPRPHSQKGAGAAATPSSPKPDLANRGWRLPSSGQPRWGGPFSNLPLCSSLWYTEDRGQANRDDRCR